MRWCGNVGFLSQNSDHEGSAHTGVFFQVRGVGKVRLAVQCAVLQPGAENAQAFETAAHRWVHSQASGRCRTLRAEWGWVGRLEREWEHKAWGWARPSLTPDFWRRLGYSETLGEKFVCAWLCEAIRCQLP